MPRTTEQLQGAKMSKKTIAVRQASHEALVRLAAHMQEESGKRVTLDEALASLLEDRNETHTEAS
jgi:hypothetical protein